MKMRLKRTTQQYIVVSLLSFVIIGGAFILIYFTIVQNIKKNYENEIKLLSEQLESRKVYVYEAKSDIPLGSRVTKDCLNFVQTYSNQTQDYYMTEADIGMVSLIDITGGTQILKGMLTENNMEVNMREVEYNTFYINSNMKDNDFIDLRIQFPNGEDYIVLSKKSIKNLTLETNNCFLWLTEEEILNMSGAVVDAYLYSGTKLYTTKYIEPNLQDASIITYQPSLASLILMEQDENIVNRASKEINKRLRKELENRLATTITTESPNMEYTLPEDNQQAEEYLNQDEKYLNQDEKYLNQDETEDKEVVVEYGG